MFNTEILMKVLKLISKIMLENGAEAHRIEVTCRLICNAYGVTECDVIATATGIYTTVWIQGESPKTTVSRINNRSINLSKINDANSISRKITNFEVTLEQAEEMLVKLKNKTRKKEKFHMFYEGIAAGFFVLLFGGNIFEFLVSVFAGCIVQYVSSKLKNRDSYQFFVGFFGSAVISIMAIICTVVGLGNFDVIIIGGIMPLLPGLAMLNAIRSTMRGDLLTGVARVAEVALVASSLAGGAGFVLYFAYYFNMIL